MSSHARPRFENHLESWDPGVLVRHFMQGYVGDPGFPDSGLIVERKASYNGAWMYLVLWSDGVMDWHDCAELVLFDSPRFNSWEESVLADLQYSGGDC